jgi:biotin transport system substrate-specific component
MAAWTGLVVAANLRGPKWNLVARWSTMIAGMTVADLARPSQKKLACLYDAVAVVTGAIIIAVSAQMAVGAPVPVTGQTFAVLIVGALLGSRRGGLCVLTYLFWGLMGLPVFAQGKGGAIAFVGPTGGYLVGFLGAAWVVGALAERGWDRRIATAALAMVLGSVALYACGLAWLCCLVHFAGQSLGGGILAVGLYPFLPGDAVKIALATVLLPSGWKILRYFAFDKSGDMG